MKKYSFLVPVLIIAAVVGLLAVGFFSMKPKKIEFSEKITLLHDDPRPYGASLAFEWLKDIFPEGHVTVLNSSVLQRADLLGMDSTSTDTAHKALIVLSKSFYPDYQETDTLLSFVKKGNDLFISCKSSSDQFFYNIGLQLDYEYYADTLMNAEKFYLTLNSNVFKPQGYYWLTGSPYKSIIGVSDTSYNSYIQRLGWDSKGLNFMSYRYGKGHIYIHTAPIAFSNYFLLTDSNRAYYEKVLSVISPGTQNIIWDNYFVTGPHYHYFKNTSPFSALLQQQAFRWAIWLIIIVCAIYILLELKRRQRIIPVIPPVKNDSLDYVETMGRLYYDKHNNYDIASKMSLYFLEHVRFNYLLNTSQLNEIFISQLAHKSGREEELVREITVTTISLQQARAVNDKEVEAFHNRLQLFYTHHT